MFCVTVFPNDLPSYKKAEPYMHLCPDGFEFTTSISQESVPTTRQCAFHQHPLSSWATVSSATRKNKQKGT